MPGVRLPELNPVSLRIPTMPEPAVDVLERVVVDADSF